MRVSEEYYESVGGVRTESVEVHKSVGGTR